MDIDPPSDSDRQTGAQMVQAALGRAERAQQANDRPEYSDKSDGLGEAAAELARQQQRPPPPPIAYPTAPSAAAKRMRLHRYRRQQGLRCVVAELRITEIETLVRMGLLQNDMRNDLKAIKKALHEFLDAVLI